MSQHELGSRLAAVGDAIDDVRNWVVDSFRDSYLNERKLRQADAEEEPLPFFHDPLGPEAISRHIRVEDYASAKVRSLSSNPSTAPSDLAGLRRDRDPDVRERVAENPSSLDRTRALLALDENVAVRWGVASNRSTSISVLNDLATDHSAEVRAAVGANTKSSPATLQQLSADRMESVRKAVAGNPSTPPATLRDLSSSGEYEVLKKVAENPHTPADIISSILSNKDYIAADREARSLSEVSPFQREFLFSQRRVKPIKINAESSKH